MTTCRTDCLVTQELTLQEETSVNECRAFERRRSKRYAIGSQLRFTLHGPTVDFSGTGTTINMSGTGLLFHSESSVPAGDAVAAVMDWPATAGSGTQVLLLQGRVVWSRTPLTAMTFSRHAFIPNAGPAQMLPVSIRLQLRRAERSTQRSFPLVLVVESVETYHLVARMMSQYPIRRVSVKAAVKMLQAGSQSIGLVVTNRLRELAPLELSIPVIYVSPDGDDRQLDKTGMFSSIIVLKKPLTYRALISAVQQLPKTATVPLGSGEGSGPTRASRPIP